MSTPLLNLESLVVVSEGAVDFGVDDLRQLIDGGLERLAPIKRGKIARIPGRRDVVLRYIPTHKYLSAPQTPERIADHLARYEGHLHRLQKLGMGIAKHTIFADDTMTYTVVERLDSSPGITLDTPRNEITPTQQHDTGLRIARALHGMYRDSVEMIWDLDDLAQYTPTGKLHDYDPYLTSDDSHRRDALRSLLWWVRNQLMPSDQQTALADEIEQTKLALSAQNTNNY